MEQDIKSFLINAKEAARLAFISEQNNAKKLWEEEIGPAILTQIKQQAENRGWGLILDRESSINKHDILNYDVVREYFIIQLKQLDFKVEWTENKKLHISWEHLKELL